MNYTIKVLDLPEQPTLTMRAVQPVEKLPELFGKAFGSIMAYLGELGEQPTGMPFGAYHNMDKKALEVEAGFPVSSGLSGKGEIKAGIIPGGKYISTVHVGAYDTVEAAYDALTQWAKENGYVPAGLAYEYYLNDPTADPGIQPETEIRFPVK